MKARLIACCIFLSSAVVDASADPLRERLPNQLAVEVGGRMPFLGIAYERWLGEFVGTGVGLGGVPCVECRIGNAGAYGGYFVVTVPVYAIARLPIADGHALDLSAGATFALPGHGQDVEVAPSLAAGYELLLQSGFVLRPSLLLFLHPYADPGTRRVPAQLWAGIQVGWAF